MELKAAKIIADELARQLTPHCERIAIAGSIRREKPEVKDIEIVAVPKPYDIGLFESGVATVVNNWSKVRGELPCKYTQRIIELGNNKIIALDLFFTDPLNWGWIFALRTGSGDYNQKVWLRKLSAHGYEAKEGRIWANGRPIQVLEEADLFERVDMGYVEPRDRK